MKIKDITEHSTIDPPKNHTWITSSSEKFIQTGTKLPIKLSMTYKQFDMYKKDGYYGVFDGGKLLAFIEIAKLPHKVAGDNIYQMKKFERIKDPNVNTKGMAAALFTYLISDLHFEILSDNSMSPEGNKFWENMIHMKRVNIEIYDMLKDTRYPLSDVGKMTITQPQTEILDPEKDLGEGHGKYRFYWLATPKAGNYSHALREWTEPHPIFNDWILFGDYDLPDIS
jgi:hypothetical protein